MSNRQWLKDLAACGTQTWTNASSPTVPGVDGVRRLETSHTIYVFRDGVCVDVARRQFDDESNAQQGAIGMRVVGWLVEIEGRRRLLERWLPGARAVMWRAAGERTASKIALTSPSFGWVLCSQTDEEDAEEVDECAITAQYTPPPRSAAVSGSFTRVFPH